MLEPVGQDRFVGRAPAVPARIYGGELAAQALAAANATVAEDRVAHALQCIYLAPGDPAYPLAHNVTRVRDGRSFSSRTVEVHNDSRLVLTATVGYHVPESGLTHQLAMPAVPPPTDLPTIEEADGTHGRAGPRRIPTSRCGWSTGLVGSFGAATLLVSRWWPTVQAILEHRPHWPPISAT